MGRIIAVEGIDAHERTRWAQSAIYRLGYHEVDVNRPSVGPEQNPAKRAAHVLSYAAQHAEAYESLFASQWDVVVNGLYTNFFEDVATLAQGDASSMEAFNLLAFAQRRGAPAVDTLIVVEPVRDIEYSEATDFAQQGLTEVEAMVRADGGQVCHVLADKAVESLVYRLLRQPLAG